MHGTSDTVLRLAAYAVVAALGLVIVAAGAAPTARAGAATGPRAAGAAATQEPWSFGTAAFVYTSQKSGNADLWLRTGPLGESIAITDDGAQDHWASWFPDGERVAFQSLRDGNREIYVIDLQGGAPENLTDNPAQDLLPEVSPDGTKILFFSDREVPHGERELPGHLYVMGADGADVERLTREPLSSTFFGAWSPDGTRVVFARDFDGDAELVVLDLATRAETRLPGTAANEPAARFSSDGSRVAFSAAGADGEARIVVMNVDGTGRVELTRGAQHYQPAWSPDGRWLMFSGAPLGHTQFDLMVVSSAGGEPLPLLATPVDERSGSWQPAR